MPNTLAHYGFQGPLQRLGARLVDGRWILIGAVIPDVPWILMRGARILDLGIPPYDLRLYAIGQASLLCSLVLCGALAVLTTDRRAVFTVLAAGSCLHLLLDALQTKWGNGVHFLVPFQWTQLNVGWFWPESTVSYALTGLGVLYLFFEWRYGTVGGRLLDAVSLRTLGIGSVLIIVYSLLPLGLAPGLVGADAHSIATLRDRGARPGREVEFDRVDLHLRGDSAVLRTFADEDLEVVGVLPSGSSVVSVRGRFVDPKTVQNAELHVHDGAWRDYASYLGLSALVIVLLLPPGSRSASRSA